VIPKESRQLLILKPIRNLRVRFSLRGFRDRDYLKTRKGYFCVVGSVHPADRVFAYLKYVPDSSGKWGRGKARFRRILRNYTMLDLLETFRFLEHYPEYLYDSTVLGIRMSAVPLNRILAHLKPEEKFSQIIEMKEPDVLERKSADLAVLISEKSGVPIKYFGITGSLLLDIHQDFSDIDLTVYGTKNSRVVKEALIQIYQEDGLQIRRFDEEKTKEWCLNKVKMFPLSYEEAGGILRRKWGRGLFQDTMFSIHPVKLDEEVSEKYGDRIFKPEGTAKIEATVSDASEAEFLPSVYKVEDARTIEGSEAKDIYEVTSYEGLYSGIAEKSDRISTYGKLERVTEKSGVEYRRILVGSQEAKGTDYIKPV
jgi:predicted nucleotidyltransferase